MVDPLAKACRILEIFSSAEEEKLVDGEEVEEETSHYFVSICREEVHYAIELDRALQRWRSISRNSLSRQLNE